MSRFKKENSLLIIGNGFDLAHGYKTKYSDFVEDIFKSSQVKNYVFEKNDDLIKIESKIYEINQNKNISHQFIEEFQDSFLIKNDFFKKILNAENYKWVDFESFYFNELLNVIPNNYKITKLNLEFDKLKKSVINYLKSELISTFSEPSKIPISDSINYHFQKLRTYYTDEKLDSGFNPIHILNFNYSNTPIRYSNTEGFYLNNIHGDFINEQRIIFGYGDETTPSYQKIEDLNIDESHKFFKSVGYLMNDSHSKLLEFLNHEDGYDVEIMGHSCGISDRVLLKTIFEHPNCNKIKIYYHEWENEKGDMDNDFESKIINISRHFSIKSELRTKVLNFKKSCPLIPYRLQNTFR